MGADHGDASGNKTEQYLIFNNKVPTDKMYPFNDGKLSTRGESIPHGQIGKLDARVYH